MPFQIYWKFHFQKNESFQIKIHSAIFHISAQNLDQVPWKSDILNVNIQVWAWVSAFKRMILVNDSKCNKLAECISIYVKTSFTRVKIFNIFNFQLNVTKQYRRCLGRAIITEHSLLMTPRGKEIKPRQAVHKPQSEEKQSNQSLLLQQGDHNARQNTKKNAMSSQKTTQITKQHKNHRLRIASRIFYRLGFKIDFYWHQIFTVS